MKYKISKFFKIRLCNRFCAIVILAAFLVNSVIGPVAPALGQAVLPLPGTMVKMTPGYTPLLIKGMRVYPDNPLRFDFIVDPGDSGLQGEEFIRESTKAMKYFLSSLTVPEKDLWVNLSPFEKDRIIPDKFGKTEMGRDMLGQDYILKQLSASLTYPETELGKKYWEEVGTVPALKGTVPTSSLSKVWIIPDKAVVYSKNNIAYVLESHLKVMMEEDYENKSLVPGSSSLENANQAPGPNHQAPSSDIFRTLILPQIEKEVNEGENFAPLRQLYNSLILATWFKRNLKQSILSKVYVGQNKIDGVTFSDGTDKNKIYEGYLEAFKKGVYNIIKEDEDTNTGETIPRKYFSGGVSALNVSSAIEVVDQFPVRFLKTKSSSALLSVKLDSSSAILSARQENAVSVSVGLNFFSGDQSEFSPKVPFWAGVFRADPKGERLDMQNPGEDIINSFKDTLAQDALSGDPFRTFQKLRPLAVQVLAQLTASNQQILNSEQRTSLVREAETIRSYLQGEYARVDATAAELKKSLKQAEAQLSQLEENAADSLVIKSAREVYNELLTRLRNLNGRIIAAKKFRERQGEIASLIQSSDFIAVMEGLTAGNTYSQDDMRYFMNITANLIRDLPTPQLSDLIDQAKDRAMIILSFFSRIEKTGLNMNGRPISFVLNAQDVFSLTSDGILEIDIRAFLRDLNKTDIAVLRYEFMNALNPGARLAQIRNFGEREHSEFIRQNPGAVGELLRLLFFFQNIAAGQLFDDPAKPEEVTEKRLQARQIFLNELWARVGDRRFLFLFNRLAGQTRYDQAQTRWVPDIQSRAGEIWRYAINSGKLNLDSSPSAQPEEKDFAAIEKLYEEIGSPYNLAVGVTRQKAVPEEISALVDKINLPKITQPESDPAMRQSQPAVQLGEQGLDSLGIYDQKEEPARTLRERISEVAISVKSRFAGRNLRLAGAAAVLSFLTFGILGQRAAGESGEARISAQEPIDIRQARTPGVVYTTTADMSLGDIAALLGLESKDIVKIMADNSIKNLDAVVPAGTRLTIQNLRSISVVLSDEEKRNPSIGRILTRFYGEITPSNFRKFFAANPEVKKNDDLRGVRSVTIFMSLQEFTGHISRLEMDTIPGNFQDGSPILSSSTVNHVGGINLDPSGLEITETGQKFKFDVPIDPEVLRKLEENPVNGFVPVILNVVPIGSLPQFLGVQKPSENPSPVALVN